MEKENVIAERNNDDVSSIRFYCNVSEVQDILEKAYRDTGQKRILGMEKEITKNVPEASLKNI